MPETTLNAITALNGLSINQGGTRLVESPPLSIVSLATPQGGKQRLDKQLHLQFGAGLPATGKISRQGNAVEGDEFALLGLQPDQCLLVSNKQWPDPVAHVESLLDDCAYITDQSDSWAILSIKGPLCRSALERVCSIDLASGAFDESSVARTAMEHLSVIIEQTGTDEFRLYSPRSSAQSFAEMLGTSLKHVADLE